MLGVNPELRGHGDGEVRRPEGCQRFAADNVADARWFIRTVNQRNQTLLKVCRAIVEFQREFFLKGPKDLRPLTLKDVAAEVGVHEATVSRITTAKYLQTDWGIFELKHFFSNAVAGSGGPGSRFSKGGVKEIVREIVAERARTHAVRPEIVGAPRQPGHHDRPADGGQVPGRARHRIIVPEEARMNTELKGVHLEISQTDPGLRRQEAAPARLSRRTSSPTCCSPSPGRRASITSTPPSTSAGAPRRTSTWRTSS